VRLGVQIASMLRDQVSDDSPHFGACKERVSASEKAPRSGDFASNQLFSLSGVASGFYLDFRLGCICTKGGT